MVWLTSSYTSGRMEVLGRIVESCELVMWPDHGSVKRKVFTVMDPPSYEYWDTEDSHIYPTIWNRGIVNSRNEL